MFLAMAEDVRVVLIKLADRLHNMRTLGALPHEKQVRIARQTQEIYAPLAERLGIWQIKWELEDLAFKVLEPEEYRDAGDPARDAAPAPARATSSGPCSVLGEALARGGHRGRAVGPPQAHLQHRQEDAAQGRRARRDLRRACHPRARRRAARTATPRWAWCTRCGGPSPASSTTTSPCPRATCYQSLHTAVVALDGKPLEVQIRTHAMHRVSEVGIAAHWRYKEGSRVRPRLRRQAGLGAPADGLAARGGRRHGVRGGPQARHLPGPGLRLHPQAARSRTCRPARRPLDFAYRIHTDVGHRCIGAKVNNRLVPLDYKLQNGDIVEIVTTKARPRPVARLAEHRPHRPRPRKDPPVVQAPGARREHRPRPRGPGSRAAAPGAHVARAHRAGPLAEMATLYKMAGRTTSTPPSATAPSAPSRWSCAWASSTTPRRSCRRSRRRRPSGTGGVRVKGVGDLLIRFAKCCHPIPGDPIVGYITRGKGVTVHLRTCPTVVNERDVHRLIDVEWDAPAQQTYPIAIRIEAYDRHGPAVRHHQRGGRAQGQHPGRQREHQPRPHGHRPGHAPGGLGGPAGAGAVAPRAAQGRLHGPARPGLIRRRRRAARPPRRRCRGRRSPPARHARHEART